jgi:hypothetical protein
MLSNEKRLNRELRIVEDQRKCLECGDVRQSSDAAPDDACPSCGAVDAELQALLKAGDEEAELAATEKNCFERGQVLQELSARQEAERAATEAPRYQAAHAVCLLMILILVLSQLAAIGLAYKLRRLADDTWLGDHFNWQIRGRESCL